MNANKESCSNLNDAKVDLKGKGKEAAPKKAPQLYECTLCKTRLRSLGKLQKHIEDNKCKVLKRATAFCMKEYNTKDLSIAVEKMEAEVEKKKKRVEKVRNFCQKRYNTIDIASTVNEIEEQQKQANLYKCQLCGKASFCSKEELRRHLENDCQVVKKRSNDVGASSSLVAEKKGT